MALIRLSVCEPVPSHESLPSCPDQGFMESSSGFDPGGPKNKNERHRRQGDSLVGLGATNLLHPSSSGLRYGLPRRLHPLPNGICQHDSQDFHISSDACSCVSQSTARRQIHAGYPSHDARRVAWSLGKILHDQRNMNRDIDTSSACGRLAYILTTSGARTS